MSPALILDCDGVLAETELNGHLPAFNRTFADLGLPLRWSQGEYGRLLSVGGGKERTAPRAHARGDRGRGSAERP